MALLLMTFLGFFSAETVIADSCDGDAAGVVMTASDGAAPTVASQDTPAGQAPTPGHSMHVCHCAHAHAGSLAGTNVTGEARELPQNVTAESVRTPPSEPREPRLRPPLA